ncbi:tetratricopeptide repeat protein, partial [bacterium]|nr:tetratricopeptide repeat protein [bacterium]
MKWIAATTIMALMLATGCASSKTDTPESRNQQASLELARQMVGQGEYQRAVQFLLQRSKAEDAPNEVHMLLGLSLLGLKNPDGALRSFSNALKLEPTNDDARLNVAYTQILLGRHKDARASLGEIVKRGKYQFLERVHLNMGLTYLEEKRCDRAIP